MALNVLVVDDSAVMRAMVIRTLRLSGIPVQEIYQAANGKEGLHVLEQHWVDLALVDLNMPVMNGEELINHIRNDPATADLAVVVVSTEGSETRIEQLRQKGVAFVHKPFQPEQLRETVIRLTGVSDDDWDTTASAVPGGQLDF